MKVLIVGASGGIGAALVNECLFRYENTEIHGTYFRSNNRHRSNQVYWHQLDIREEESIERLASRIDHLDWIINCVGFLHNEHQGPEKNLHSVSGEFFLENIAINTLPTLLLAKYFSAKLKSSEFPKFATLSARVGSLSDNHLGGWYSYRSSKAALNMLIKTLSIEWKRTLPKATVLSLHPGTTDTELSLPFQANVPKGKLFSPEKVAKDLIDIIESKSIDDSGNFYDYSGEAIPW
ncbi:SDR family oxidoreductase [Vibrio tubiashii]|uniref:SDR family oxidoreductase n=1 Tax=Vibrio tubiashii TaxID=29498 RepID=A0AAE5GP68_9VIBR|nr:SDR family oxidoreductase [Vibrio tubiashii]NOI80196.1 SDR family oxidoreductase [Vibrio tubiashii]